MLRRDPPRPTALSALPRALAAASLLALGASGCVVRQELYDQALANLDAARRDAARAGADAAAQRAEGARRDAEIARLGQEMAARDARLAELSVARADDAKKVDDLVALNDELAKRLKNVGQSVEELAGEKGALSKALTDTRARLEELRRLQAAAEARAEAFRDLVKRFQAMVDAGQLKVVLRDGKMLLELPNDVLFDSGKTDVKDAGKKMLAEIGRILKTLPDRTFQVGGHTDNVQIRSARFPSNWELSTARAVEVVKLLIDAGMAPRRLSAAGFGEFAPAAPNDTPEARARNRRIEIALIPDLAELVNLSGADAAPKK